MRRALAGGRLARAAAVLVGSSLAASALLPLDAASAGVNTLPQARSFTVWGRGAGHGHGMSQYGAYGAAARGLSTTQILNFYYPGARRTVLRPSRIRVRLSNIWAERTTVFATTPGLRLCRHRPLPLKGVHYYRLGPYGSGLRLLRWRIGAHHWETVTTGLRSGACFASDSSFERILNADGSSTRYRGYLRAVRSGAGEFTVDDVSLDNYAAGVAPREMPASWYQNAVHSQAIAARTYGRYAVEHAAGAWYDICDTTSCQVYGGMAHYSSGGSLQWTDDRDAIVGNENTVLTYQGHAIFAQFSASNGGAETYGGFPYLPAKADPYDNAQSDPYFYLWKRTSSAKAVASYFGLRQATAIEVTKRDGYGPWGGRVVSGYIDGVDSSGHKVHWARSGYDLGAALGVDTSFFAIDTGG
jgi:peptidoglycan hydrolase-like amidase